MVKIAIILVALFTTAFSAECGISSHPADVALEKIFRQHEAEFSRLVVMSRADSRVMRIAPNFTWLTDNASWPRSGDELGFSQERWDEYRQLFRMLGLKDGLVRYADADLIYLFASSKGLVTGGSGKGYVYSERDLTPTTDSLDQVPPELLQSSVHKIVYKRIEPNWYLFLDMH